MFAEFKKFINQGNIIELAVAFIMATTFAAVVKSLIDNLVMPPIGALFGGVDFASLYVNLSDTSYPSYAAALEAGAPVLGYGVFINTLITFLLVMLVLFFIVRAYNRSRLKPVPEADTKECPYCLTTIPLAATRCPACTSEIRGTAPAPAS